MDPAKFQKIDPAILLLNEIDILLAQTSLMELYLKQAQATAADVNARLQEKVRSRAGELASRSRRRSTTTARAPKHGSPSHMSASVEQLQRELSDKQQLLSEHESAVDASRIKSARCKTASTSWKPRITPRCARPATPKGPLTASAPTSPLSIKNWQ
jgi:hypothetical protein